MTVAPKRLLSVSRARSILPPFHFGPYYPRTSRTPRTVTAGIVLLDLTIIVTAMAGPAAYALAELLKEPFGPYWEDAALTKAAPSTTPKNPLPLRCVLLESGGLYTGYVLGQTEAGFVILCALCAS